MWNSKEETAKRTLLFATLAAGSFLGWTQLLPQDPVMDARFRCEMEIERFSPHNIGMREATRADVARNITTITVTLPFEAVGRTHIGKCIFEDGQTKHVSLDGALLPQK